MKKYIRRTLSVLLLSIGIGSGVLFLQRQLHNGQATESYDQAVNLAFFQESRENENILTNLETVVPEKETVLSRLKTFDLATLQEGNPDVLGWIMIPGTTVDYPLLQGSNNDYYLGHTWDKKSNTVGSIYMDYRNAEDLSDFNTIIYGHNMNDGSMFSNLNCYVDPEYWKERSDLYLVVGEKILCYEIFATFQSGPSSFVYTLGLHQEDSKESFLQQVRSSNQLPPDVEVTAGDQILTLSTCEGIDYSQRRLVMAKLKSVENREA